MVSFLCRLAVLRLLCRTCYGAGNAAVKNNDWKTAEAEFEKVVRLMPQIEEGHSNLGAVMVIAFCHLVGPAWRIDGGTANHRSADEIHAAIPHQSCWLAVFRP